MPNRLTILLLLCFVPQLLAAQIVVEGRLSSSDGTPVSGINIMFHPKEDLESIIAYGFSKSNGDFRIAVNHSADTIVMSVKSMHYADTLLHLANRSQTLAVPLVAKSHMLDEARVQGRPIYRRGDTTIYSVQAFALKQDFSIGDVIKKMPGFDVDDNGRISFQGQAIQKYYIEGLDLLESRYALANNNLPHTSVGSVEVLHNHQPIKAVDGIMSSSSTSLNIKLKRNMALTGRAQAAVGFSPLLWDINVTPMMFNKNQQLIGSWQSNNTGYDLSLQHQTLIFSDGKLDGVATLKSDLVSVPQISSPAVAKNKYLDNEANLVTYNHLFRLSSNMELKLNGSYYHDRIAEEGRITTTYYMQDSTLNIYEHQKNSLYRHSLIANLSVKQNVKSRYLLNKVSFGRFWDSDEANLSNGFSQNVKANLPHTTVANTLDVLIPVRKNFLRVESMVDYNDSPQQLSFTPGVFIASGTLEQQYSNRNLIAVNKLGASFPVKSFVFSTSVGVDYEHQKYETAVVADGMVNNVDSLKNSLKWNKTDIYAVEDIELKRNGFTAKLGLPLQYTLLDITDNIHNAGDNINRWFFKPSAYLQYKPAGSLTGNILASYSKALGSMGNLLVGNVIVNHRMMRSNQAEVDIVQLASLRGTVTYHNPANGLFADLSWSCSNSKKELMLNQIPQGNGLFIYKYERRDGDTRLNSLSSELSWYISGIKTTIGAKGELAKNRMDYLLSSKPEVMDQQLLAITPKLLFGLSKYFSISYSYRLAKTKTDIAGSSARFLDQKHKLDFYIYATTNHLIGIENELYHSKRTGQSSSQSLFSNIVYTYKPSKINIGIKLECRNLFNTDKLVEIRQSEIVLLHTEYYLRPRQLLLTVTWSLGRRSK